LAIQGDTLWVTDIDVLRGFDRHTGRPVANVDFKPLHAVLLNDVGAAPDGSLYISDTGILMTDKGVVRVGGDKIFRLAAGRSISLVASGDTLGRPNGVSWDAKTKRWLVVTFSPWDSRLLAFRSDGSSSVIARGSGEWDGLEMMADGRALVTSWRDSSVHLISGASDERVIRGVSTPADLGVDTKRGVIAIPQIMSGRVEFWTLPKG
jgi:sugar lactone lactonase YvrE